MTVLFSIPGFTVLFRDYQWSSMFNLMALSFISFIEWPMIPAFIPKSALSRLANSCDDFDIRRAIQFNDSVEIIFSRYYFHIFTHFQNLNIFHFSKATINFSLRHSIVWGKKIFESFMSDTSNIEYSTKKKCKQKRRV